MSGGLHDVEAVLNDTDKAPVIAANDPEERVTIFMMWMAKWSDGTPVRMTCNSER